MSASTCSECRDRTEEEIPREEREKSLETFERFQTSHGKLNKSVLRIASLRPYVDAEARFSDGKSVSYPECMGPPAPGTNDAKPVRPERAGPTPTFRPRAAQRSSAQRVNRRRCEAYAARLRG